MKMRWGTQKKGQESHSSESTMLTATPVLAVLTAWLQKARLGQLQPMLVSLDTCMLSRSLYYFPGNLLF